MREFLRSEQTRTPCGCRLNIGSASRRFEVETINLDIVAAPGVDVLGDSLCLPARDESVDTIVCTGVLEHVSDARRAVNEMHRVLKRGGRIFLETAFMQTVHASPRDYCRWTPDGLRQLMSAFDIADISVTAGPASAFAWTFQQTMAMLFSFRSDLLYKAGLRVFGWFAMLICPLDILIERHPMAWRAASGFAVTAVKRGVLH